MKTKKYTLIALSLLLGFSACQNSASDRNAETLAADSLMDTVSASNSQLDDKETNFLQQAAAGGLLEVEASSLAMQKSTNAKVKEVAQMILDDHRKANAELSTIAGNKGLKLPATLNTEQSVHMDKLNTYTGDGFDRYYLDLMVAEHDKAISLFTLGTSVYDKELEGFAAKTLPKLRMHRKMVAVVNKPMKDAQKGQGDDLGNESGKMKKQ